MKYYDQKHIVEERVNFRGVVLNGEKLLQQGAGEGSPEVTSTTNMRQRVNSLFWVLFCFVCLFILKAYLQ